MTDILLIQPPIRDFYMTAKRTIPYGLACIASALIQAGFTVEILDALATRRSRILETPAEMDYLRGLYGGADVSPFALFHRFRHYGRSFSFIEKAVRESGAFLVGISSLFTAYSGEAMRTAEVAKKALPHSWVAVGGHHATELPEAVMQCRAVDFVLRGEGETSMPVLAQRLKAGADISSVPGIVYRTSNDGIHIGQPAITNTPDDCPLPASHLIEHRYYSRKSRGSTVVVASRGCPLHCSYCATGASSYIRYRRRSVARVLHEIECAVGEDAVGFIDFEDENISMDRLWFLELLQGIGKLTRGRGIELRAMNGIFPPTLDEEVIRSMKDAGFKVLNLSLGTTSRTQLKAFGRPDATSSFDECMVHAAVNGLEAVGYIIVGAPGQDPLDSVADLLYLASRNVLAGVSVFYPAPGSRDFARCREAGLLPSEYSLMRSTALPISDRTTRLDSITLLRLGRILNFIKSLRDVESTSVNVGKYGATSKSLHHAESAEDDLERDSWHREARRRAGLTLLRTFLLDATIPGMTPQGETFRHKASEALCQAFRTGLLRIPAIAAMAHNLLGFGGE